MADKTRREPTASHTVKKISGLWHSEVVLLRLDSVTKGLDTVDKMH